MVDAADRALEPIHEEDIPEGGARGRLAVGGYIRAAAIAVAALF
jgi:hypothetical protein